MDIPKIKSLIESSEKAAELRAENFFLSSVMLVSKSLAAPSHSTTVNFYNKQRNEIASFNASESGLEFSGLSPPMRETEILPLEIEKVAIGEEEVMKKCGPKAPEETFSRAVLVLRTSTNSRTENGPTWQASIFLKNLHVVSVVFDAENGEEIASTKMSLSSKL